VAGLRAEVNQALLKRGARAIARITPHLAVGLFRLLILTAAQRGLNSLQ
jgi:hypothetical protein